MAHAQGMWRACEEVGKGVPYDIDFPAASSCLIVTLHLGVTSYLRIDRFIPRHVGMEILSLTTAGHSKQWVTPA